MYTNGDKKRTNTKNKNQHYQRFCAALELELRDDRENLKFYPKYKIDEKKLRFNMLFVEKVKNTQPQNEIEKLFRKYNILRYAASNKGVTIDDFFKLAGYAYIYKGVNHVLSEEMMVLLFCENRPVKLMKKLTGYGYTIYEHAKGTYYVEGLLIPVQIINIKELDTEKSHLALKILAKRAKESDINDFAEYAKCFTKSEDRKNADIVLQVNDQANETSCESGKKSEYPWFDMAIEISNAVERKERLKVALKQARKKGIKLEKERLLDLCYKMELDNRQDEFIQSLPESDLLQKLYKEYRI